MSYPPSSTLDRDFYSAQFSRVFLVVVLRLIFCERSVDGSFPDESLAEQTVQTRHGRQVQNEAADQQPEAVRGDKPSGGAASGTLVFLNLRAPALLISLKRGIDVPA